MKQQQRGGTFLGLVMGVVVGLGAALAVAVYVTKVPIPFVNKGQIRTADQDEAETKKNKDWDPNAPLYGKNPSQAIPQATQGGASGTAARSNSAAKVDGKANAKTDPKADTKAEVKADPKADAKGAAKPEVKPAVSADPLGDLAKSKTSNADGDVFSYFVQVGAYRTNDDAEAQRAKLTLSGVETKISEREQSGAKVFRVRVGPFEKKEDAERAKEKLDKLGLDTALVRVQR